MCESFPHDKSREERIDYIENRLEELQNIFHLVEKYVKSKWDDKVELKGSMRDAYFGHEGHATQNVQFDFYIDSTDVESEIKIKHEILNDLEGLFGIESEEYGEPVDVNFYRKKWDKF